MGNVPQSTAPAPLAFATCCVNNQAYKRQRSMPGVGLAHLTIFGADEGAAMLKLIMPMKRRPGMSVTEFRTYYETHHRVIGEKYLAGYAARYMRRFTNPTTDRDGQIREPEYDVFLEIWYPDEATMQACSAVLGAPAVQKEIKEDEARLFDTRYMRAYLVDESVSDLPDL